MKAAEHSERHRRLCGNQALLGDRAGAARDRAGRAGTARDRAGAGECRGPSSGSARRGVEVT